MTRVALALLALGALFLLGRRRSIRRPGAPLPAPDDIDWLDGYACTHTRTGVDRLDGYAVRDTWADPNATTFRIITKGAIA